jgi:23S rRNA (adenine-N6)-dimethyltransferase
VAGRGARGARPPRRAPDRHFLRSSELAAALVGDAGEGPDDLVLDIGAGSGRLTAPLAVCARAVEAIELDTQLASGLRARFRTYPNVRVREGDALVEPLPDEPFRIVANPPFGRTTAILRRLLDDPRVPLVAADLVVEWGLACKRTRLHPSTLLGVYWGAWFDATIERRLPRRCFDPAPHVDAAVLRLSRRSSPLVAVDDARPYLAFLRAAFGGRRVLAARAARRLARRLGADPGARPAELDRHQWAALFASVRSDSLHSARPKSFNSVL